MKTTAHKIKGSLKNMITLIRFQGNTFTQSSMRDIKGLCNTHDLSRAQRQVAVNELKPSIGVLRRSPLLLFKGERQ